ncbi:hypothetical protein EIP86_001689 [Pleurotus ostreatoroseus]|nr:hypothetical protein EIP86_001689 [Pleurotus ostreatoroseus]
MLISSYSQPTPPPKLPTFKPSLPNLSLRAPSETGSIDSTSTYVESTQNARDTVRKSKSTVFGRVGNMLKKTRSRSRLRPDRLQLSSQDPVPPLPSPTVIPYNPPATPPLLPTPGGKWRKGKEKSVPPPLPTKDPEISLDTNIDNMEGIINTTIQIGDPSSPSSAFTHSSGLNSDVSSSHHWHPQQGSSSSSPPSGSSAVFSNPFLPTQGAPKRKHHNKAFDYRRIGPKQQLPGSQSTPTMIGREGSPGWKPPPSWAVDLQDDEEGESVPAYSSSDSEDGQMSPNPTMKVGHPIGSTPVKKRRKKQQFKFRIYRANNTYHVASIALNATVAALIPYLNGKLLLDPEREKHTLYLKERGRERILASTEKPANIVRKRLMEAGFDEADDLTALGVEDIQYLMKFVYKSNVLGRTPNDENLKIESFEYVDLSGRGLKTVPVALYPHAEAILILSLSRNPMLDIPLDFIQACTTLRELRLSMMAIKKVPLSIRHCKTLHRLDLSSNRITDLTEAGLSEIPGLRYLKLQNNGLEKLPWYFPRLRSLRELNISNNKFRQLPEVVCRITSLLDLDISFNSIADLPEEMGNLVSLEKLVMVGNEVTRLPQRFDNLQSLRQFDCRRNNILDVSAACELPRIENILADHNALHAVGLAFGPSLHVLDASHNEITQLTLFPSLNTRQFALQTLDISHAKLSSLDDLALSQLTCLYTLKVDHNSIRALPESIGELTVLRHLSCSNNQLYALPASIGRLQKLERLEVHNNSIAELPTSIWECSSLCIINMTSNLLGAVHEPENPEDQSSPPNGFVSAARSGGSFALERKTSAAGSISNRVLPPLAYSLEKLYLGENRLTEDSLHPLALLRGLKVLNLSFNDIQVIPSGFLKSLTYLEELYLSGNKLTALPTEDLPALSRLKSLFLNGNRLQSLPQELGKITELSILDVGSNLLKYNTANWEFDWNWNFNLNLRYLNLSGNKRLEIKQDHKSSAVKSKEGLIKNLADFSSLESLKILGLMDVTTTFVNIPDDNEERRVRTSLSEVNGMAYGIADTLGGNLSMFDLVQPAFRDKKNEAIFAMFGRASHIGSNKALSKYLHDHFLMVFVEELTKVNERDQAEIKHAIRRTFLRLNKYCHDFLYGGGNQVRRPSTVSLSAHPVDAADASSFRSGASGVVLYFVDKMLYVANAGNALAVLSRQGNAELLSRKHDPFDKTETQRIRHAEGWVSPKGYVNDDIDVSRSFGFYFLFPVVNARPDIVAIPVTELDEFVIIGNRGLWDFVSYQTAVDIARTERADPMIAAQKLRDFAVSYGAEGTTMIMVISFAGLFSQDIMRSRQPTLESLPDSDTYFLKRPRKPDIGDRGILRLEEEVPAPIGHVALVFTDIRNSTHLWECNSGMPTAITAHNNLLRRQLRFCGGYEVKTEGDAFVCSFPTVMAALWWCLSVQIQLLHAPWPLEILECEDGKEIFDTEGKLIARGLSVRMGIHCGTPMADPDPTTHRMDYLGPVVNRAARISGSAAGGQIMCSADVIREIDASIYDMDPPTEHTAAQPSVAVGAIRRMRLRIEPVGEVKLKGLEMPESLSLVYPLELAGRHEMESLPTNSDASGSRVQFSVEQMRELAMLCIRLETLTTSRVFKPLPLRKGSKVKSEDEPRLDPNPVYMYGNPEVLLPTIDKASDSELMLLLDSLSARIENALAQLTLKRIISMNKRDGGDHSARRAGVGLDVRTLQQLLSLMPSD